MLLSYAYLTLMYSIMADIPVVLIGGEVSNLSFDDI
jgi:hypothetical protein